MPWAARCLTSCIPAGSTTPLLGYPGDPFLLLPFIFGFPEQCFAFPCLFSKRAVERRFSRWRGRVESCKSRAVNSGSFFMLSGKRVANCHKITRSQKGKSRYTQNTQDVWLTSDHQCLGSKLLGWPGRHTLIPGSDVIERETVHHLRIGPVSLSFSSSSSSVSPH